MQTGRQFFRGDVVCPPLDDLLQHLIRKDLRRIEPGLVGILPFGGFLVVQLDDLGRLIGVVNVGTGAVGREINRQQQRNGGFAVHPVVERPLEGRKFHIAPQMQDVPQEPQPAAHKEKFEKLLQKIECGDHLSAPLSTFFACVFIFINFRLLFQ